MQRLKLVTWCIQPGGTSITGSTIKTTNVHAYKIAECRSHARCLSILGNVELKTHVWYARSLGYHILMQQQPYSAVGHTSGSQPAAIHTQTLSPLCTCICAAVKGLPRACSRGAARFAKPLPTPNGQPRLHPSPQIMLSAKQLNAGARLSASRGRAAFKVHAVAASPKVKGAPAPSKYNNLTPEVAKDLYYDMTLGREFEEMCAQMYYRGKMFGFVHLYSGQVRQAVALCARSLQERYFYAKLMMQ